MLSVPLILLLTFSGYPSLCRRRVRRLFSVVGSGDSVQALVVLDDFVYLLGVLALLYLYLNSRSVEPFRARESGMMAVHSLVKWSVDRFREARVVRIMRRYPEMVKYLNVSVLFTLPSNPTKCRYNAAKGAIDAVPISETQLPPDLGSL